VVDASTTELACPTMCVQGPMTSKFLGSSSARPPLTLQRARQVGHVSPFRPFVWCSGLITNMQWLNEVGWYRTVNTRRGRRAPEHSA
jgi:hypothetical protein